MAKTVFHQQRIATEKPTCRYQSGKLPRSPFPPRFQLADIPFAIVVSHQHAAQAIIAPTDGPHPWHETRSL